MDANIETTPEVEIEPATVAETPDVVDVIDAEVIDAEAPAEEVEEVDEAVVEDAPAEEEVIEDAAPIEFAEDATIEQIVEQAAPVLEKYELPPDVQSYIDVLKARAEAVPMAVTHR